jgi:hypothetical protein
MEDIVLFYPLTTISFTRIASDIKESRMRLICLFFLFVIAFFAQAERKDHNAKWSLETPPANQFSVSLIPYPSEVKWGESWNFFNQIDIDCSALRNETECKQLLKELKKACGLLADKTEREKVLCIVCKPGLNSMTSEAYSLNINNNNVEIAAKSYAGFFNAVQTFRQLIVREKGEIKIPSCNIQDEPAFQIRGVMLDVGRTYMPIHFLKEIVRNAANYKMNVFHWHLTDYPGYRIESKKFPQLNEVSTYWPTRQPGMYYTQNEIKDFVTYCASLNVRVIPEIDMPGHSSYFEKAFGFDMQTPQGLIVMKDLMDEVLPLFTDSLVHIGSDEVKIRMKNFMPEMIQHIRNKGKEVIAWSPGHREDSKVINMLWAEAEFGGTPDLTGRFIDANGFYIDWIDSQSGVNQVFFQQPCRQSKGDDNAMGSVMSFWTDAKLSSHKQVLVQYPFYPCMLTFAERLWRGAEERRKDLFAQVPEKGTKAWEAFDEFENRLINHRDKYFVNKPFSYVKQSEINWSIIGPFNHQGKNDKAFAPEKEITESYQYQAQQLTWEQRKAYGGAVHIRHFYNVFDMHKGNFNENSWPSLMSEKVGNEDGTCYALTYIESPKEQDVYAMVGINEMWGITGGYRSAPPPELGSWDFSGGDVWLNNKRIEPPVWPFKSLLWGGWGKGRIEEQPLTQEGYFFRPPVKIHLKKGLNKVLVRSVFGHWKQDNGQRKWFFCFIPVIWDGTHFREVKGLKYRSQTSNEKLWKQSSSN